MSILVISYRLTTDAGRDAELRKALAALARELGTRDGCLGTALWCHEGAYIYRFEETWQSDDAHRASMDPALKALLKAVMNGVTAPIASERLTPVAPAP
ncbi:putative quinol monooxygenase [Novosphingobium sp.]|uniref:putative quinol monooxygenase n=1 Tax=Novosphingobium sp. TaxID=1874826 RepID=UPI003D0E314F